MYGRIWRAGEVQVRARTSAVLSRFGLFLSRTEFLSNLITRLEKYNCLSKMMLFGCFKGLGGSVGMKIQPRMKNIPGGLFSDMLDPLEAGSDPLLGPT